MEDSKLNELLERYRTGKATPEDKAFLESWYLSHNQSSPFLMSDSDREKDIDKAWKIIQENQFPSGKYSIWFRIAAAASLLIFLSLGSYFLFHHKNQVEKNNLVKNDIAPGRNKATLTLANGQKVILSDSVNGQLASEAGVTINKTKTGELIYTAHAAPDKNPETTQFNTLATSNGEQYHVVLPDGSNVWLNAASSLKYPIAFNGNERLVELSGEAYFEVTHNKKMPFKVKTAQQQIQVLGTHFNIDAYQDEVATTTTLIEGSVKVTSAIDHKYAVIKPGQQSIIKNNDLTIQQADTDDAIAWKNGYFLFDEENLAAVMLKISRWYNVKVEYKDSNLKEYIFSGTVSRYKNLSQIIKVLELTHVAHFSIDGNKISVTH